jgi:hypothetical protein
VTPEGATVPTLKQTVHHASGTYVAGAELAVDHPLVVAGPHLFDDVTPAAKPVAKVAPKRKSED